MRTLLVLFYFLALTKAAATQRLAGLDPLALSEWHFSLAAFEMGILMFICVFRTHPQMPRLGMAAALLCFGIGLVSIMMVGALTSSALLIMANQGAHNELMGARQEIGFYYELLCAAMVCVPSFRGHRLWKNGWAEFGNPATARPA